MNIKIDKEGDLWIERAGKWKVQVCPFGGRACDEDGYYCGDRCPHFGEPIYREADTPEREPVHQLWICQDKLLTGTITDERAKT